MTVFEYIEIRKKELIAFADYWEKNRQKLPNAWPETMDEGEWYEQEIAVNQMQRGE